MELYQLEELAALAEYGSISKAAESVGVSQPAMSRSMTGINWGYSFDTIIPITHIRLQSPSSPAQASRSTGRAAGSR